MAASIVIKDCQIMCIQRFMHILTPQKSIATKIPDHVWYTRSRLREHIVSFDAAVPNSRRQVGMRAVGELNTMKKKDRLNFI